MKNNIDMKKLILCLIAIALGSFTIAGISVVVTGSSFDFYTVISKPEESKIEITDNFQVPEVPKIAEASQTSEDSTPKYKEIDEEKILNLQKVEEININTICADINVFTEDRDDMKVHFYGNTTSYIPELETEVSNEMISVKVKHKLNNTNSFMHINSYKLDIYIPSKIESSLKIETTSGNVDIESIEANDIDIITISGSVNIKNLATDNFDTVTASGGINIESIIAESIDLESTSGEVIIKCKELADNTKINSVSGDIKTYFPENAEFSLEAGTISGEINCKLPVTVKGTNKGNTLNGSMGNNKNNNNITINTVSGDIKLDKE